MNQPPTASFTYSTEGLALNLAATWSDPDDNVGSVGWDFGDGSTAEGGSSVSHNYDAAGTYTVSLTVSDEQGASAIITCPVTVAPVFHWYFTWSGYEMTIYFDAGDAEPNVLDWDFGNGTAHASVDYPEHTYATAGTYTVTLTATNPDDLVSVYSRQVTVPVS